MTPKMSAERNRQARKAMEELRTEEDFERFLLDHFSKEVRSQVLASSPDRLARENKLLEIVGAEAILRALRDPSYYLRWLILADAAAGLVALGALVYPACKLPHDQHPKFRIETGMHTGEVRRIAVHHNKQILVSASVDKSIRVWDMSTKQLRTTIRVHQLDRINIEMQKDTPEIGHHGNVYAVSLSPDGATIAAGGQLWESAESKTKSILRFTLSDGHNLLPISPIEYPIYDLKYSPDGKYLAMANKQDGGLVVEADLGFAKGLVRGIQDSLVSLDFDRDGRFATAALDGTICLYNKALNEIARIKLSTTDAKPYSVRFSPDGNKLAVAYMNRVQLSVLQASPPTLTELYKPDTADVQGRELSAIAWSDDGRLCAAGDWLVAEAAPIRCWSDGGQGPHRDIATASETIYDLVALPNGQLAFASGEPGLGIVDASGQPVWFQRAATADFRNNPAGLLVDETGARVQFSYENKGRVPAVFSLQDLGLTREPTADPAALKPARTELPGHQLKEGPQGYSVLLDGQELPLHPYERVRSRAIAPNGSWLVLGTARYLRRYRVDGAPSLANRLPSWMVAAPGATQQVNISGDGRIVVASFHDGTIRWYQAATGKELVALFPHRDRERWVAWTPEGFYAASPRGEELFGWQLNPDLGASTELAPASTYRHTYLRPAKLLSALQAP